MKPFVVILAGATASGKTSLALELTDRFPFEIVGADSLQLFRCLDIGTAKPTPAEVGHKNYYMIDVLDPDENVSAAWYAAETSKRLRSIWNQKKIPLIVGGSGFYIRALEFPPVATPANIHSTDEDMKKAYNELQELDPEAASHIHPNDRYRVGRALGLARQGKSATTLWSEAAQQPPFFESLWLGIEWSRKELYAKINHRVSKMFEDGLLEETEEVLAKYPRAKSRLSRAIGYRQALQCLDQTLERDEAITEAQTRSRQYAKRQHTWFGAEKRMEWLAPHRSFEEASLKINKALS